MLGAKLGAYEVLAKLGEGGMGQVYRARDTTLGRQVAIKVLPPEFVTDPERVGRFHREAQVLAALNHPHIAQIYGYEESLCEGGHHQHVASGFRTFLVLELVDGETLDRRIARGPIAIDEALPIAMQIAEALAAGHIGSSAIYPYAMSPDGQRFLILRAPTTDGVAKASPIAVITNWRAPLSGEALRQ